MKAVEAVHILDPVPVPILVSEYLMGRDEEYPLSEEMYKNTTELVKTVNCLLRELGIKRWKINSGYRPGKYNEEAGGSTRSAHLTCEAVDLADPDGELKGRITEALLVKYDLYMEHPNSTPTWCHLQSRPTRSGRRIFKP
jgi:hypothetical protein